MLLILDMLTGFAGRAASRGPASLDDRTIEMVWNMTIDRMAGQVDEHPPCRSTEA